MTSKELFEEGLRAYKRHHSGDIFPLITAFTVMKRAYEKQEQEIKQAIEELQIWDGIHIADGEQVYKWHDVNEMKLKIGE